MVSSSHSLSAIQDAIFAFVDSIPVLIHLLSVVDFQNHLESQISEKQRADASLYDAAVFNWYEITEGKVDFQLRTSQTEYLKDPFALETKQVPSTCSLLHTALHHTIRLVWAMRCIGP